MKKKVGRWAFVVIAVAILSIVVAGNVNLYRVHSRTKRLKARVEELNSTIDSLTVEIQRLKSDTAYIEHIARERLGMARKDEKVYKFVEEPK